MASPVLVITNAYPDFEGSYHGIFVRRSVEDLAELGWFSHVLVPRIYKNSAPFQSFPTHTVTRFPFLTAGKLLIEYDKPPVLRIGSLLATGVLFAIKLTLTGGCRLVHAHWAFPAGLIGLAAARLTGRKLVLTVHGSDCRLAKERGGLTELLFKQAARGAARIISVSRPITDYLIGLGIPEQKIVTCPMGVDERIFHQGIEPDPGLAAGFSVVSTRNLLPLYRVADLIEAAAQVSGKIPGFKLIVAGEGSESASLRERSAKLELGDKVSFIGRVQPGRLAVILASSSLYVSTSPVEGSSVSLLEAMACGCLPVVTDIPANREWITDEENGLLFTPGDPESLAACLLKGAGDQRLREEAALKGPRIVAERGLWSRQIETLDQSYRKMID